MALRRRMEVLAEEQKLVSLGRERLRRMSLDGSEDCGGLPGSACDGRAILDPFG